jgi:catechol 2,3-dioxygenase-like lactoylglutathione lyase family enzyme
MSRVQLALRVSDLDGSVEFYSKLFGVAPAKRRPGYANFAVEEPPLKLVLIEGDPDQPTALDHLGVEVFSDAEVAAASARLEESGLVPVPENNTTCCYALQDKVWVHGPGNEPWEVYVVKADAGTLAKAADSICCATEAAGTRQSATAIGQPLSVAAAPSSTCC